MHSSEPNMLNHKPSKGFAVAFSVSAVLFSMMTIDYYRTQIEYFFQNNEELIRKMNLTEEQIGQQKRVHLLTETYTIPLTCWSFFILFLAINEYRLLYKK